MGIAWEGREIRAQEWRLPRAMAGLLFRARNGRGARHEDEGTSLGERCFAKKKKKKKKPTNPPVNYFETVSFSSTLGAFSTPTGRGE
jgi:hypothetical protein